MDWFEKTKVISGVYHYAASGQATWYGFAKAISEADRKNGSRSSPKLIPIPSSEYSSPACCPLYSVLSQDKIKEYFGITAPDWKDQLSIAWTG